MQAGRLRSSQMPAFQSNTLMKLISFFLMLSVAFPLTVLTSGSDEQYDLVIINARIIDGTGNPWFRGSVAIKDGKIAKVGRFERAETKYVIDAKNRVVAPGFIDVHAHTEDIFNHPAAENFVRMGVTSLVTGNCGDSTTDVAEFLGRYKEKPLAVNVATLIGHNS